MKRCIIVHRIVVVVGGEGGGDSGGEGGVYAICVCAKGRGWLG